MKSIKIGIRPLSGFIIGSVLMSDFFYFFETEKKLAITPVT
jgi:hypothetical protein